MNSIYTYTLHTVFSIALIKKNIFCRTKKNDFTKGDKVVDKDESNISYFKLVQISILTLNVLLVIICFTVPIRYAIRIFSDIPWRFFHCIEIVRHAINDHCIWRIYNITRRSYLSGWNKFKHCALAIIRWRTSSVSFEEFQRNDITDGIAPQHGDEATPSVISFLWRIHS